jgi:ribosomal protein S18 acetylase RimI-like enzyme
MNIELYFLRSSEHFIVKDLLHYAARLDESGEALNDHPDLEQYHRNYGNYNGDIGVYLFVDNKVAGGAWVRMLLNGFGHVDTNTPELAFAVLPEYRNQGLGTQIMQQLMREVAKIYPQMSLSVREENPVIHLFERLGFTKVDGSEQTNSAGALTFTMLKIFEEQTE